MVLTLRWRACVAQFQAEGRPILLAPSPYSRRRWLDVEALVFSASRDSPPPVSVMVEDAPWWTGKFVAENRWADMDEDVNPRTTVSTEDLNAQLSSAIRVLR